MNWNKPKDDGGLPITGYLVEKMDTATGKWVPAGFVEPTKTEHKIHGLEPNRKYHFRVKALNDEGESEPLETDAAIVAKNPYGNCFFFLSRIIHWKKGLLRLHWKWLGKKKPVLTRLLTCFS